MFAIAGFVITDLPQFSSFIQVDLHYPEDKMQFFDEYPPCCEKKSVSIDDYSEFMKETMRKTGSKPTKQTKLVSDLKEKHNYKVHYLNLILLLSIGVVLSKVHRVVR